MTTEDLEILIHMMNGGRPPEFAVRLLEDVCRRTNLDWKARHVYLQKRKNKSGTDSWQAVLSIDGFREAGSRCSDYAGQEGPFWSVKSPEQGGVWFDMPTDATPYAAKCGIRKRLPNGDTTTTWGVAKYKDYYAGMMWDKFPSTMIAKCAEMLAWRKTFPKTFGGLYGDAEMQQQEKTLHPSQALKALEVIGESTGEEAAPEGTGALVYQQRLRDALSGVEVKAIGAEIQKDKSLDVREVAELHILYTQMKKKYE